MSSSGVFQGRRPPSARAAAPTGSGTGSPAYPGEFCGPVMMCKNVTDSQSEIRIKKQLQKVKCIHRGLSYCLILNITSSFPTIQEMPITYFIVLIPG